MVGSSVKAPRAAVLYPCLIILLGVVLTGGSVCRAGGRSYAGDMAQYAPGGIQLVASGTQAAEYAGALQSTILRQPKLKKHTPATVRIVDMNHAGRGVGAGTTFVFLLIGREMTATLPPALLNLMPAEAKDPASTSSVISCSFLDRKRGVFAITLFAPDKERFGRIFDEFLQRQYNDYDKDFGFTRRYTSNKVALFSAPEIRPLLAQWGEESGENVWNFIAWHSLEEADTLSAEQLNECHQVYFLDRSQAGVVPKTAAGALSRHTLKPTTIIVDRSELSPGRSCVVFSTPNRMLLESRIQQLSHLNEIPNGPSLQDAVDLRHIGRAPLLVSGIAEREDRERVRLLLAKNMRQELRVEIEERGDSIRVMNEEVALQQLLGATDTATKLRRAIGSRYAWLFTVTRFDGTTEFEADENCLTSRPAAFSEPEPHKPSQNVLFGRDRTDEEYAQDLRQWERNLRSWEEKKRDYEEKVAYTPVQWQRTLYRIGTARAEGILRLVDLKDVGRVVWEKECTHTESERTQHNSDRVTVRGFDNHPDSMSTPYSEQNCPAALRCRAAERAGLEGIAALQATAWLPDGQASAGDAASVPEVVLANDDADPRPRNGSAPGKKRTPRPSLLAPDSDAEVVPETAAPQVALVEGNVVTITAGTQDGLGVGSRVEVAVKAKEIKHPGTGELLERIVTESLALRVTRAGKTSDCVPLTPDDEALLAKVQPGMTVSWSRTLPPSRSASNKSGKLGVKKAGRGSTGRKN